jgi:hypothetical protein
MEFRSCLGSFGKPNAFAFCFVMMMMGGLPCEGDVPFGRLVDVNRKCESFMARLGTINRRFVQSWQ